MKRIFTLLGATAVLATLATAPVFAQGAAQTVALIKVDTQTLATGWRTSKIVGAAVTNEAGDKVGSIDDLIVTPNEKVPFAVLSVGGFLGVGNKLVVVPYSSLNVVDKKLVLPGATKDSLKTLPEYTYATN
ncbi:PRC-barrel domain containing protein [Siculibacillus lacustris]|uniref:PRC-barrel domain containing protein n=1 Tax=Siculibacillus lacustris TaxID=1549641 RepID=A0A4Q9VWV8_9HYPH|nr:PRC-barrel domain-containing protein [Siculibacillus lacustris]TBW40364.1 PRC-barrel domain containing protein [Siculibacillus lacustris]